MSHPPHDAAVIEALQGVADGVVALLDFDVCAVSIAQDGHRLETVVVSRKGETSDLWRGMPIAEVERELALGQPWHCFHRVRRHPEPTHTSAPATWPPLDLLVAPIRDSGHRLRGLVQLGLPRERALPDSYAFDVLSRFTDQTRHAVLSELDRGRLVERVRLADAARLIVRKAGSELSMERIMEISQPAMASGFEAVGMWMQTFDEDGEGIDLVYGASGRKPVIPDELKQLSRTVAVQLWESQRVAVVTDHIVPALEGITPEVEQKVCAFVTSPLAATSMLFVPLGAGRECLGNLALTRRSDTMEWSDPEKQAALDIGHDLGRALLNARTFERERRLAVELSELDGYKTRLISTLAHELKNPLTAIAGHAEMLQSLPDLPGGVRHSVAAVERGAARMQSTIENLLLLAEIGNSHRPLAAAPVDMAALVDGVLDVLRIKIAGKNLKVTVETSDAPVLALGEAPGLDLVCSNLISNAVKYTPSGGSVTISLRRAGQEAVFEVTDTGIGISEGDQGRLFEEFFRSTNPAAFIESGTGLGLAIVQRIVDRHQGSVHLSSALGVGSTFTISLPAVVSTDS